MNDKIARFAVGSISPYFVSTSFKIQVQNIKAQASGVLELFLFTLIIPYSSQFLHRGLLTGIDEIVTN